jgi:hypothetical protein
MAKKNKVPKVKKVKKPKNRLKRFGVFLIVVGVLYGSFMLFVKANGFTTERDVVVSFVANLEDPNVCNDHFVSETESICEVLVTQFEGKEVEFTSGKRTIDGLEVVLTVDDIEVDLLFNFEDYEPSGLRSYLNDEYYLIDTVE